LPNLDSYTGLTESEKELFRRPTVSDDESSTSRTPTSASKVPHSPASCDESDAAIRLSRKRKSEELDNPEAKKGGQESAIRLSEREPDSDAVRRNICFQSNGCFTLKKK